MECVCVAHSRQVCAYGLGARPHKGGIDYLLACDSWLTHTHTHMDTQPHPKTKQTIAIYGYSLCAFVPLTLLNFVPNNSVPWLSEVLAAGASTVFLLKALGPTVREKAPQQAFPFLAALG
jgi:hypothetical protein